MSVLFRIRWWQWAIDIAVTSLGAWLLTLAGVPLWLGVVITGVVVWFGLYLLLWRELNRKEEPQITRPYGRSSRRSDHSNNDGCLGGFFDLIGDIFKAIVD